MVKALDYFPCYHSYRETLSILSYEEKGRLFDVLIAYSAGDMDFVNKAELSEKSQVAFAFIKGDIDRARKNYQTKLDNYSRAAKEREAEKSKKSTILQNLQNSSSFDESKSNSKSESESNSKSESESNVSKDTSSVTSSSEEISAEEVDKCPYKKIMEMYNSICVSFPSIRLMSETRKRAVHARWKACQTLSTFEELFKEAESSDFLKGNNNRGWKADFDWLMNEQNMAKVLEHKYSNTLRQNTQQATSSADRLLQMIREGVFDEPEGECTASEPDVIQLP